jgi:3-polyprenyl-4-hydroxybenzoate decarboxylase
MMGYYGPMHLDPIYHVTAITMRKDALHQTVLHGCGNHLERAESVNISSIIREAQVRDILTRIGIEVTAVRGILSSGECQHVRVAIRQTLPGQARNAISTLLGSLTWLKHVFVTDDDIDLFDEHRFEWAFATRFQADKDIVMLTGVRGLRMDPSMEGKGIGTKAGFDLTFSVDRRKLFLNIRSEPHVFTGVAPRFQTVEQALQDGPKFFTELMEGIGTRDGREVSVAIDALRDQNRIERLSDGKFSLTDGGTD